MSKYLTDLLHGDHEVDLNLVYGMNADDGRTEMWCYVKVKLTYSRIKFIAKLINI
jgi:hypothetical protein